MYECAVESGSGKTILELKIDIDKTGPYRKALNYVSGTINTSVDKLWYAYMSSNHVFFCCSLI